MPNIRRRRAVTKTPPPAEAPPASPDRAPPPASPDRAPPPASPDYAPPPASPERAPPPHVSPNYAPSSPDYAPPAHSSHDFPSPDYLPPTSTRSPPTSKAQGGAPYDPTNPSIDYELKQPASDLSVEYLQSLVSAASQYVSPATSSTYADSTYTPYGQSSYYQQPTQQSAHTSKWGSFKASPPRAARPVHAPPSHQRPYNTHPKQQDRNDGHRPYPQQQDRNDGHRPYPQQQDRDDGHRPPPRRRRGGNNGGFSCDLPVWIPHHVWNQYGYHPPLKMGPETNEYFDRFYAGGSGSSNHRPR